MAQIFGFIIGPMESALVHLVLLVGNAGIAIILFTIIVRLILSPLTIVQLRSQRAMSRLQPHIGELRKKHGKDKQKLTEETMKLYREHKVNPAMGCLPMLLQFPVLIGLFYALMHLGTNPAKGQSMRAFLHGSYHYSNQVFTLFHENFLWLSHGLGHPDPLYILPVLAGVTQWIQSRMMLQQSSDPQQQTMNTMMNFMPLMIVFFATRYASGLSLYWVTSTVIGILLQVKITGWGLLPRPGSLFRRTAPAARLVAKPKPHTERNGASNGKAVTDADIVLASEPMDEVITDGETPTQAVPDVAAPARPLPRSGARTGSRKRTSRPRGRRT